MEDLNRRIKELDSTVKMEPKLAPGVQKICDCEFKVPFYSRGIHIPIPDGRTERVQFEFLELDRYYCPICNVEFPRLPIQN